SQLDRGEEGRTRGVGHAAATDCPIAPQGGAQTAGEGEGMAKATRYSHHYLKAYRLAAGVTLEEMAGRWGLRHASIQRMENFKQPLTQPVIDKFALTFHVRRGAIFDEPPDGA